MIETDEGPVLVDTGPGQEDYIRKPGIVRAFQPATHVPLDPEETTYRQIIGLGYSPEEVGHILLTHMHFDHCGGLPDFPKASIHVHAREYQGFGGVPRRWNELAYVRRHIAHRPKINLTDYDDESWFDFKAIRLSFDPEMWLIPLFGHSRGHCGLAV